MRDVIRSFRSCRVALVEGLLGAILVAGCATGPEKLAAPSEQPPTTQTPETPLSAYIGVNVAFDGTLGDGSPSDAGTVTLQQADTTKPTPGPFTVEYVPSNGFMGSVTVAPGTYTLTYQPPTGYHVETGMTPQTVTVGAGDDFRAEFSIAP